MIELYNNIQPLYEQPVQTDDTYSYCPVCNKAYKNRKSLTNHLDKQNCYSYVQVFQDTTTEQYMYSVYKDICTDIEQRKVPSVGTFRKSRYYKPIANLFVYCSQNKMRMHNISLFVMFCAQKVQYKNTIQLINTCSNDELLRKFRKHLMNNEHLIDSERFYNENKDRLEEDTSFMIRSLERADIGFKYLIEVIDIEKMIEQMTNAETRRLNDFLDMIQWR